MLPKGSKFLRLNGKYIYSNGKSCYASFICQSVRNRKITSCLGQDSSGGLCFASCLKADGKTINDVIFPKEKVRPLILEL